MQNEDFLINEEAIGDSIKLFVKGRVTSINASALDYQINEALKKGISEIIINMMQVAFLSSAGIRVLLMYFKKCKENGGSLRVENPSENVINVLGMTALDEMLLK